MKKIFKNLSLVILLAAPLLTINIRSFCSTSVKSQLNLLYTPKDKFYDNKEETKYSQKEKLAAIGDLESTWDIATGKGITVAVIDTGLDIKHLDFQNNISDDSCYIFTEYESERIDAKYETKINIGKEYIFHDENGSHGTSVAGIIGANNNEYGIVGIAFDATILAIKCDLDSHSVNEAIKYATDCGARVINISMGAYAAPYTNGKDNVYHGERYVDYDERDATSMLEGINYAYEHDVIIIAAGGNENTNESIFPASNEHVIGVGSLDDLSSTTKALFSNFNKSEYKEGIYPNVDIVAPGYVLTDLQTSENYFEPVGMKSGTSFSSPIVAASAALWCEKNIDGTPDEFEKALYATAKDIGKKGFDNYFGNGLINIKNLLEYKQEEEIEKIEVEKEITLNVGDEHQLNINVLPEGIEYDVSYVSSDTNIVTINSDGLIKAISSGEAKITIKIGKISEICSVIVKNKENKAPICVGNIYMTSTVLSVLSLFGIILIVKKKFFEKI